jgi:hypothetical protein
MTPLKEFVLRRATYFQKRMVPREALFWMVAVDIFGSHWFSSRWPSNRADVIFDYRCETFRKLVRRISQRTEVCDKSRYYRKI